MAAHDSRNEVHQFIEPEDFGSNGIDREIAGLSCGVNGDSGEVFREYRLQSVVTRAWNREEGEFSQQPCDIVYENISGAEDQGRPHNRVRDAGTGDSPFDDSLTKEIAQRRILRGVRNADMDESRDPGPLRGFDQRPAIGDRALEGDSAPRKSDPIRVEKDCGAFEASGKRVDVIEVQGHDFDFVGECVRMLRMIRQRSHLLALLKKLRRYVPACKTECAGYHVEFVSHSAPKRTGACYAVSTMLR